MQTTICLIIMQISICLIIVQTTICLIIMQIWYSCFRCYYPLHRGSSCTGPTVVDKEQNTITDVVMVFILDQGMILNSSQSG